MGTFFMHEEGEQGMFETNYETLCYYSMQFEGDSVYVSEG
jgi:hypothetical protein